MEKEILSTIQPLLLDSGLELKRAVRSDLNSIYRLEAEYYQVEGQTPMEVLEKYFDSGFIFLVVKSPDGKLVGNIIVGKPRVNPYIYALTVDKDYQGKGLAKFLLTQALKICKINGDKSIYLHVRVNNKPAVKLYLKNGFKYKKVIPGYYPTCPAYLMTSKIL